MQATEWPRLNTGWPRHSVSLRSDVRTVYLSPVCSTPPADPVLLHQSTSPTDRTLTSRTPQRQAVTNFSTTTSGSC